jgi:ribonuclease BN (tRNA processing enzyme)
MTNLQLTPLGTSPAWYNPGEPTSGFILEADGQRVLVDCGSGVIARYLELFGAHTPIDAIVISHVHADHCFDLVPLSYGIEFGSLGSWKPQLWLPPGARERLGRLATTWDETFEMFEKTFDVHEYEPGASFQLGPLHASSVEVPHYIESFALRLQHGDTSFGYTSDLGPCEHVAPFLGGVDLMLAEAAFSEDGNLAMRGRGHITASEAGKIAADAGAHSLLLTHVPVELGVERAVSAAKSCFAGPVDLAHAGERYDVAARLAAHRS